MGTAPFSGRHVPDDPGAAGAVEDLPPIHRLPWLTPRRLIVALIGWLVAFSIGSIFIANPFASEPSASANPDYWRVMYLHGMLIAMVGLLALLTCQVMRLRSRHVSIWIAAGVVVATLTTGIGGIFDTRVPGAEAAMWTQITGFFALDEILVVLITGFVLAWRRGTSPMARTLPYWTAFLASCSMLAAAIMGHLAGWLLEFGAMPGFVGGYVAKLGISVDDLTANLTGSHSHDMVVAVMALLVAIAVAQFGREPLTRAAHAVSRSALAVVAFGVVVMTAMYLFMGFTTFSPPTLFQSADGTNGIAGDDILTGVFIMGAGLVSLGALIAGRRILHSPIRLAAAWAWLLSFATVVIAGYAIEMNETYFGAGDPKASGAEKDAVFTWLHQDIGLFLLPALVLLMLVVERLVVPRVGHALAWITIAGSSITFLGGLVYTFVDPALHGPGYALTTIGLVTVGAALLGTMLHTRLSTMRLPALHLPQRPSRPAPLAH